MLERARPKLDDAPASFVTGDAQALPYRTDRFDAAVLVTVLGEVPDPGRCLDELRRVLRPGGRLVIAEMGGDPDFISLRRLRPLVAVHGFAFDSRWGWHFNYNATFELADREEETS